MKNIISFIIIFLSQFTYLYAEGFCHLNLNNGLSSREVFQINQDASGFIWAYTSKGMDRFDGSEFKHYVISKSTESKYHIQYSTIITTDRQGIIWVAQKNGKIYSYNKIKDSFDLRLDISNFNPTGKLNNLYFDKDNCMWICLSNGLLRWPQTLEKKISTVIKGISTTCIVQNNNEYYIGTFEGLYKIKATKPFSTTKIERVPVPSKISVTTVFTFEKELYIGTVSKGVFTYNIMSKEVKSLDAIKPSSPIRSFALLKDKSILIGADGAGIYKIDSKNNSLLKHYLFNQDDERSLSSNSVTDIYVDKNGRYWISTSNNGISFSDIDSPQISWTKHELHNSNSLISNHVNAITQDSHGDFWYGTNDGISLYIVQSKKWTHFLNNSDPSHSGSNVILTICEDSHHNIWTGGYGFGVYQINKANGTVKKFTKFKDSSLKAIASDYIYSICKSNNKIWMGGIDGQLICYDIDKDISTCFPADCVGYLKESKKGYLLIAGCAGLGLLNKEKNTIEWHNTFGNIYVGNPIRFLCESHDGNIWMATDGQGLICYNPTNHSSKSYSTINGISSNSINNVIEDDINRIWFTTEKDLYCLDTVSGIIVNINDCLHLNNGNFNAGSATKTMQGILMFGTADGVLSIPSSSKFGKEENANLIFTDFKLLYKSEKAETPGSVLKECINETHHIVLKYNQNSFSLAFSSINFISPFRIKYKYKLENYDEHWQIVNEIKNVSYMNLSPGRYVFRLQAFDRFTLKQIGEKNVEIIIKQPFWLSTWAILFYLALIAAFSYLYYQYRIHKNNEKKATEKVNSFISFAHDIRTPITLIKAPLSEIKEEDIITENCKKAISLANKNVDKLYAMINQLLNLQKIDINSKKIQVSPYDVSSYMEDKISDFRPLAIQKKLDLLLVIEDDISEVFFDKNKMDHIMDNLISNALKYTQEGTIWVKVSKLKKKWIVEVQDTGIGIPESEQVNIFSSFYRAKNAEFSEEGGLGIGLVVVRKLVKQLQGNISFISKVNLGTTFKISFPLKPKACEITSPQSQQEHNEINYSLVNSNKDILLLAEDDKDLRDFLVERLSNDYQVINVPDGGKALEYAKEMNPDIIISDVMMPVISGDELCRIITSSIETSHIPVVLLSALGEKEDVIKGLEAGATDYITKPFDLSVLKIRLKNILQNRQHIRDTIFKSDKKNEEIEYNSQLDKEFLDKAIELVNAELDNAEYSINEFCQSLCMSRTSVYNKIKALTGQGPNDFIRIIRLNKAKELLETRKYPVNEISFMVGFSDPKYFSTCFKKQFGISPSKV